MNVGPSVTVVWARGRRRRSGLTWGSALDYTGRYVLLEFFGLLGDAFHEAVFETLGV